MSQNANEHSFKKYAGKAIVGFLLLDLIVVAIGALGVTHFGCASSNKTPGKDATSTPSPTPASPAPSPKPARRPPIDRHAPLRLLGILVAERAVAVAPRADGAKVERVLVFLGQRVRAGQTLVVLAPRDARAQADAARDSLDAADAVVLQATAAARQQRVLSQSAVASADAAVRSARAQFQQALDGARPGETAQADAALSVAKLGLARADADLARHERLAAAGAIAPAEVETLRTNRDIAEQQVRSAGDALGLLRDGARRTEIEQARQALRQSEESLRQARAMAATDTIRDAELAAAKAARAEKATAVKHALELLDETRLRAPFDGVVTARDAEPGQIVGPTNPPIKIATIPRFVDATAAESDLPRLSVGAAVAIAIDAISGPPIPGRVVRVEPTARPDSRGVIVRISLPTNLPPRIADALRPGLTARVQGR